MLLYSRLSGLVFLLLFSISFCNAAILIVKQDGSGNFSGIQPAYLAASSGDTILVYPGTYFENLDITNSSKNITIASMYLTTQDENYIHNTIIDGYQNGSCIAIRNTEQAGVLICGFTIENGSGYGNFQNGGGIYIYHANPTIAKCIVQKNKAGSGGGIYCRFSVIHLSGVTIRYNNAYKAVGGVYCSYNSSTIFDPIIKCNIYLNYAPYCCDYSKTSYSPAQEIIVDTFTVFNPDQHFIYSHDVYNYPVNDLNISIENAKIEPVNHDLYVNPLSGNNSNDGLSPATALKTIAFAYNIIASDSLNPYCIFLSNGIYSTLTNGELFPLNGRGNISLIGENRDSTIFDADSLSYFFRGYGRMDNFAIKNITFQNGYGNVTSYDYSGLNIVNCNNVWLDNLHIQNCSSSVTTAIEVAESNNTLFTNLLIENNPGGPNLAIGNSFEPPKSFEIRNCKILNASPDSDPEVGEGGGLLISGSAADAGLLYGKIINTQITDNLRVPDPYWGPGMTVGLIVYGHATVDLINATIGNNVVRGVAGFAVNVDAGSELNVYNSIFYGDSLRELSLGSVNPSYPSTANIAYSCFEGGAYNIVNWNNLNTLNWLDGNTDKNPNWVVTGDTAYQLLWNSPLINAGTPMYQEGMDYPYIKMEEDKIVLYKYDGDTVHLPSTDLAGKPRISGGIIDMGAYEFQDTTTYLKWFPDNKQENIKIEVYPNPFTAHIYITFHLQNPGEVIVLIYDINGRLIKTLMDAKIPSGECKLIWKGDDNNGKIVGIGTYYVTLYNKGFRSTTEKIIKRG